MQLTLPLPQACSAAKPALDSCSSGLSTPTWTASDESSGGPATPPANGYAATQTHVGGGDAADQQKHRSAVSRRLQLKLPCEAAGSADGRTSICTAATACRVLSTSNSYGSVCDWLDQQVLKRVGPSGALIAACSHTPVDLDPLAWEAPSTPDHAEEAEGEAAAAALPAPAFQLLGLL